MKNFEISCKKIAAMYVVHYEEYRKELSETIYLTKYIVLDGLFRYNIEWNSFAKRQTKKNPRRKQIK